MVIDPDGTFGNFVQTLTGLFQLAGIPGTTADSNLVDDPQTLPEFLDTAQITVVAISVFSDGDVELDLSARKPSLKPNQRLDLTSSYLS